MHKYVWTFILNYFLIYAMKQNRITKLDPVIFSNSDSPHPIDIHVGQKLRERRIRVGMSQEKLAEATGVTFQQIQKYEIAKNRVSASRLFQFSILLNVSVDYFFNDFNPLEYDDNQQGLSDNKQEAFVSDARMREERKVLEAYFAISNEKARKSLLKTMKTFADS